MKKLKEVNEKEFENMMNEFEAMGMVKEKAKIEQYIELDEEGIKEV